MSFSTGYSLLKPLPPKIWNRKREHFSTVIHSGGGFFLTSQDFGRLTIHSLPALFLLFFKVEISFCKLIPSLGQDQSTVAQWAEMIVPERSCCVWACFLIGSHTMPGQWHSQPTLTSLGQGCMPCLGVTCNLHFWQNDQGLLHATAVTRGWSGHWLRVSTQSYFWKRKFSHRSCRNSN